VSGTNKNTHYSVWISHRMCTVTGPPGPRADTVVYCAPVQPIGTGYEPFSFERSWLYGDANASATKPNATATCVAFVVVHVAVAIAVVTPPMQWTVSSPPGPPAESVTLGAVVVGAIVVGAAVGAGTVGATPGTVGGVLALPGARVVDGALGAPATVVVDPSVATVDVTSAAPTTAVPAGVVPRMADAVVPGAFDVPVGADDEPGAAEPASTPPGDAPEHDTDTTMHSSTEAIAPNTLVVARQGRASRRAAVVIAQPANAGCAATGTAVLVVPSTSAEVVVVVAGAVVVVVGGTPWSPCHRNSTAMPMTSSWGAELS